MLTQGCLLAMYERALLTFSCATNPALIDNFADVRKDQEWKLSALIP